MNNDFVFESNTSASGFNYTTGGNDQNNNVDDRISIQMQNQINRQQIVELQDQDNRNFTLGGLLSCLETIAYKLNPKQIFRKKYDGYNPKSVQEKKTIDQLIIQLRLQSKSFHNLYDECCDKYEQYWYPDNLSKDNIIGDITNWKKEVPPQYKVYYDNIINILQGEDEKVTYPSFKKVKKGERASCDPNKQLKLIPPNIAYINYRRKIVKLNYLNKKKFDNTLKLNSNDHIDKAFEKMNERYKKAIEEHNSSCICEDCCPMIESLY